MRVHLAGSAAWLNSFGRLVQHAGNVCLYAVFVTGICMYVLRTGTVRPCSCMWVQMRQPALQIDQCHKQLHFILVSIAVVDLWSLMPLCHLVVTITAIWTCPPCQNGIDLMWVSSWRVTVVVVVATACWRLCYFYGNPFYVSQQFGILVPSSVESQMGTPPDLLWWWAL